MLQSTLILLLTTSNSLRPHCYPSSDSYFRGHPHPTPGPSDVRSAWSKRLRSPAIENLRGVVEHDIHIIEVQPTNLQQMHDATVSLWSKIYEDCFQHLVNLDHKEWKQPWSQKVPATQSKQVPTVIKWPMSVYSSALQTFLFDTKHQILSDSSLRLS